MTPQCLTVLAPIRPGQEDHLRAVLRAIGDDITGKQLAANPERPHIDLLRSHRIHFARFAVLNDADRGPGRARLLFASVFDGTLEAHLNELVAITSAMDAIWAPCEGYTNAAGFPAFIRAHAHEPSRLDDHEPDVLSFDGPDPGRHSGCGDEQLRTSATKRLPLRAHEYPDRGTALDRKPLRLGHVVKAVAHRS